MLIHRLLSADAPTFWEEVWQYLSDTYFSVNFEEYNYNHIQLTANSALSIRGIIIGLFLGVMIAAAMSLHHKRTLGDLVRAIDRESCYDVERAKTLHELGLLRASSIKSALRRKTVFARTVKCVGEEDYLAEQKQKREAFEAEQAKIESKLRRKKWRDVPYRYDFSIDRFYIPEDKAFGALTLFNKKGTNPLNFIFVIAICIALMVLCCYLLPEMVQLADNFVGVFVEG